MVRIVSFDVWGTLLRTNPTYRSLQRELIRDVIGYSGEMTELRRLMRTAYAELDHVTEQFGTQFGMRERLERVAEKVKLPLPPGDVLNDLKFELVELQMKNMPYMTEQGLPELFAIFKEQGKQLAVISNTNMTDGSIVHEALAHHGLAQFLDFELYSDQLGFAKPDARIFESLVERSGVSATLITHVGDNLLTDLQGSRACGFESILYERRRRMSRSSDVIWSHSELLARLA